MEVRGSELALWYWRWMRGGTWRREGEGDMEGGERWRDEEGGKKPEAVSSPVRASSCVNDAAAHSRLYDFLELTLLKGASTDLI